MNSEDWKIIILKQFVSSPYSSVVFQPRNQADEAGSVQSENSKIFFALIPTFFFVVAAILIVSCYRFFFCTQLFKHLKKFNSNNLFKIIKLNELFTYFDLLINTLTCNCFSIGRNSLIGWPNGFSASDARHSALNK